MLLSEDFVIVTATVRLKTLQWRHNGHDNVSNHQPHDCLFNRLFRRRSKKISKLRVTGLCAGISPETGEFPAQMASNAENVSIWWRHHGSFHRQTLWQRRLRWEFFSMVLFPVFAHVYILRFIVSAKDRNILYCIWNSAVYFHADPSCDTNPPMETVVTRDFCHHLWYLFCRYWRWHKSFLNQIGVRRSNGVKQIRIHTLIH